MKKIIFILAAAVMALTSCTNVEVGEVGLKVYRLGSKKGQVEVLGVGRYALSLWGKYNIEKYPVNVQQWSWIDRESVHFQSEGQDLSSDIGITFTFQEENILQMYGYFKKSPDEIVEQFMKKDVRSFFNEVSANLKVDEVYSAKKEYLRQVVTDKMREKYAVLGIDIQEVTYLSLIRLPEVVQDAINLKITAKQRAEQRENEIAEKEAEAKKKAAEAQGEADRLRIEASGRAEAEKLEAQGRAKAMEIEGKALRENPNILQLRQLEMQTQMAKSSAGWKTVVLSSEQSSQLLNIGCESTAE